MKSGLFVAVAYLLAAGFAVKWLWMFWTPICNEACPENLVIAIYLALSFVAVVSVAFSALTAMGKLSIKRSLLGFSAFAVLVFTAAAVLMRVPNV